MENKNNKSLFWYGFFANVKKGFGQIFIWIGGIWGLIALLSKNWSGIIGLILLIVGIVLYSKGHSQRFDYKRQSGHIIHGGDR